MTFSMRPWVVLVIVAAGCGQQPATPPASTPSAGAVLDRSVLPIPDPAYPAVSEIDARKATAPARFVVTAPPQAPNVVIVLLDDFGFGQSSAFGGGVAMPNLERIAANGRGTTSFTSPRSVRRPESRC